MAILIKISLMRKKYSSIADDLYSPKTLQESLIQHFKSKLKYLLKWEYHN